jgi:hypothetical protein
VLISKVFRSWKTENINLYGRKINIFNMKIKISFTIIFLSIAFFSFAIIFMGNTIVFSAESQSGTIPLNFTVAQTISISMGAALTNGIWFGTVNPNTIGNPGLNNTNCNNSGTCYNFTVTASSTVAFWNKLNAPITCTGGNCYYNVTSGNVNNTYFTTNTTFSATAYTSLVNCTAIASGSSCWTRYWLDLTSGVASGAYGTATSYAWCANTTAGAATC